MMFDARVVVCGLAAGLLPGVGEGERETGASDDGPGGDEMTAGSSGESSGDVLPTGDVLTTTEDPTGPTTAEPVTCDTPEGCTAMEEGDLSGRDGAVLPRDLLRERRGAAGRQAGGVGVGVRAPVPGRERVRVQVG
jgi:hypothetical protein